jgi:hypothetical protein
VKYRVKWQPAARDELTESWLAATSDVRRQITAAAREIELALQRSPHTAGESRPSERRVCFEAPLGALFEIDDASAVVRILKTWRFETKPDV